MAWKNATRNVIDIDDVRAAVARLMREPARRINVANPANNSVSEIVEAFEKVTGKTAVVDWMETGAGYAIDVAAMRPIYRELRLPFDDGYLLRAIQKYYGS